MKKITLTIGVPAYNEEANIKNLLLSFYKQAHKNYNIQKIIVALDGCTDNSYKQVLNIAKAHSEIEIINDKKRRGKAYRLNQIYKKTTTPFLLSVDADLLPKNTLMIDSMVNEFLKNPKLNIVGARFIPIPQKTFIGKISNISYQSFEDAVLKLKNGNNIYSLMGGCHMVNMSLGKNVRFPKGTISDQNYLYMKAIKDRPGSYTVSKNSEIYMKTVSTLKDWRILGVRSTSTDKESVYKFFGEDARKEYYMPKKLFAQSLMKYFVLHPVLTFSSILMNIYIRTFPYMATEPENGIWITTISSKSGIFM